MADVLVVAELFEGAIKSSTNSAITFAKQVAEGTSGSWDLVVIGEGAEAAAKAYGGYGAGTVFHAEVEGGYLAENYAPIVSALVEDKAHDVITATATLFGKELMPRIAGRCEAGVAADISKLEIDGDDLIFTRPMFAGNVFGRCKLSCDTQVVTVRQSEFDPATESGGTSAFASLEEVETDVQDKVEFISLEVVKSERPALTDADVVVSGGRALKSAENFETVLEPLVDALNAAMGASRAACDAGYVPNDLQVGQTGKVVAPKLYIAVGISGAIQHLAGMKGSKTIVAINKDKEAPIATVADYFLVADLFDAVPAMTTAVKAL